MLVQQIENSIDLFHWLLGQGLGYLGKAYT